MAKLKKKTSSKSSKVHQRIDFFFVQNQQNEFQSLDSGNLNLATPRPLKSGWYCVSKRSIKDQTILGSNSVLYLGNNKPLEEGIVKYFSDFRLKGIGQTTIRKIVEEEKIQFLFMVNKGLLNFKDKVDLPIPQIKIIDKVFSKEFDRAFLDILLRDIGLRFNQVESIRDNMGSEFITNLLNEPETLLKRSVEIDGVDKIVSRVNIQDLKNLLNRFEVHISEEKLILMSIEDFLISEETQGGHTCRNVYYVMNQVAKISNLDKFKVKDYLYRNKEKFHLFSKEEKEFVETLDSQKRDSEVKELIEKIINKKSTDKKLQFTDKKISNQIELSDEQLNAINGVINSKISIITGGPGSGKSTAVIGIVKALEKFKKKIKICTPTGRAKKRLLQMPELNYQDASTIHMYLELLKRSKAEFDFMIIDESSMVDINILRKLLTFHPVNSSLIFIGDVDQLPPVSPGQPFKDMIDSGKIPTFKLTGNFRQESLSNIVKAARNVIKGEEPRIYDDINGQFSFIEVEENEEFEVIRNLYFEQLPAIIGSEDKEVIQILSPQKTKELGTINLNISIQQILFNGKKPLFGNKNFEFFAGDKIIETSNKNDLGIMNGDIGSVVRKSKDLYIFEFDGEEVEYSFEGIQSLELAYAITVHKSQGSEYEVVIIQCSSSHSFMLKRNLIYTALTRGKKKVILVGQKKAFLNGLQILVKRNTNLNLK